MIEEISHVHSFINNCCIIARKDGAANEPKSLPMIAPKLLVKWMMMLEPIGQMSRLCNMDFPQGWGSSPAALPIFEISTQAKASNNNVHIFSNPTGTSL